MQLFLAGITIGILFLFCWAWMYFASWLAYQIESKFDYCIGWLEGRFDKQCKYDADSLYTTEYAKGYLAGWKKRKNF